MIVLILFNAYFNRGYDCAMIGHTQFFLWSRYSDIISLLTISLRGVSNKHCLLPFFIEPRSEKTGLRGFQPGPTQTGLYCHRRWLEA